MKQDEYIKSLLAHFPTEVPEHVQSEANEQALLASRYIFVSGGKNRTGYCTHCHNTFPIEKAMKQDAYGECPSCLSEVKYKKDWLGRKTLIDTACILHCQKSVLNPDVVTAEWVLASRDYRENFQNVQTEYTPVARYVYDYENKLCQKIESGWGERWWTEGGFSTPNSVSNRCFMSKRIMSDTFEEAIAGTPFQYSAWQRYNYEEILKYLPLVAKYPSVEILTKAGMEAVVETKIYGHRTFRALNWSQTKLHRIFKMTKQDFELWKRMNGNISFYSCQEALFEAYTIQQWRKEKSKIDLKVLLTHMKQFDISGDLRLFEFVKNFASMHRVFNYATKQCLQDKVHYGIKRHVLLTWRDYLSDCKKLNMDLSEERVIFPKNLRQAHEETIKKVQHYEDELMRKKAQERAEMLEHFKFELGQFRMVVPKTGKEIIDEGSQLNHCVGGYAQDHVNGRTTILFIRNIKQPNKPFYTVEVRAGKIAQVRGHKNKPATEEVKQFVDAFKAQKLTKKKARKAV